MSQIKIPTEPNKWELAAREEHEHGVCFYGNHAICMYARAGFTNALWTARDACPPVNELHVEKATRYLELGQWKDGTGSYSLKHRAEEMDDTYVSNGALIMAAFRLGLGVAMSFPHFEIRSPNARILKLGKVPSAHRGRRKAGA